MSQARVQKQPLRLPILLTPEVFIRDIPVASADGFVRYVSAAADLRKRFNINLSRHVPKGISRPRWRVPTLSW